MVTFICEYCDATLKKNQCDKHVMGRCKPAALICIDCSKTFKFNQYKGHTVCISEMDKHWGQYAPSKIKNQSNKNGNNQSKKAERQDKAPSQTHQQIESGNWKGWKNQIKRVIAEQSPEEKKVQLQSLKKIVLKRYHDQFQKTDKDEQIFLQKLQKLKKVKVISYVILS